MDDFQTLQGTWVRLSVEANGAVVLDEPGHPDATRLHLTDRRYTLTRGDRVVTAADLRLDPAAAPKRLDLVTAAGGREVVVPGIYRLADGLLTICLGRPGVRPADFSPDPDPAKSVAVFRPLA
jgi:uncharacterized protein (TIGR03067 family)